MDPSNLVFENALIISNNEQLPEVFHGWVQVKERLIVQVGGGEVPDDVLADRVIDAGGSVLMPGFVNTHAHSHSTLTRGSAEGLPLDEWLTIIEKEQKQLTADQEYAAALATYAEALLSGTTCISDMCFQPEAAIRAAEEIGIRAVISPYVAKTKPFTPTLEDTRGLLADVENYSPRIAVWCGLHDIESCGDEQILEGKQLAAKMQTGLHMHCAETEHAVSLTKKRTGKRPVFHLADLGVLNEKALLAHCVWVNQEEIRVLADRGAHVAHCPHANLKLGSGIAPIREMIETGVNVTLATDGAKANNRLDMFDVMKFASLLHKGYHHNPSLLPPETIFDMATRAGAKALGINAGMIKEGALADIILIKPDQLHLQPMTVETALTNIVHAARGSDVDFVMVEGKIIVEDGRLLAVDYQEVLDLVRTISEQLLSQ